jgi:hypothetical protein
MAHGERAQLLSNKRNGNVFGSRRPCNNGYGWCKTADNKRVTHSIERAHSHDDIPERLREYEDDWNDAHDDCYAARLWFYVSDEMRAWALYKMALANGMQ